MPAKGEQAAPRRTVVLAVDDLEEARDFLKRTLESAGFHVLRAATLEDALSVLGRFAVDAVVADLWLAGPGAADGANLLDAVKAWHPGIRCLVLMTADPLGATLARDGGFLFYDKDEPVAELVALIRGAVPRG